MVIILKKKIITKKGEKNIYTGEWQLWIYQCSWKIEKNGEIILTSEDERGKIERLILEIRNKKIFKFEVSNDAANTILEFQDNYKIFLLANKFNEEQWMFFYPEDEVIIAVSGKGLIYEKSNII